MQKSTICLGSGGNVIDAFKGHVERPMPNDSNQNPNWGQYLGLGLEMAVGVGIGYAIGLWLDRKYGWAPRGATIGALLGIAGGMYLLIKQALKMNKD